MSPETYEGAELKVSRLRLNIQESKKGRNRQWYRVCMEPMHAERRMHVDQWMFEFAVESKGTDQMTSANKEERKMLRVIGGSQADSYVC